MRQKLSGSHQEIERLPPTGDVQVQHPRGGYHCEPELEGCPLMADVAYALVFLGIFLVLALTLRGLERL